MEFLVRRLLRALFAMVIGALLGTIGGSVVGVPVVGAWLGAAAGVLLAVFRDGWRGHRLMDWLRGPQEHTAPRDTGYWGELAYRIERLLRQRDRAIDLERQRLAQFLDAIEASPNGVLMLDANDQIDWCNSVSADHFGLDPVRDRRQPMTNLVRAPAFVAYLQDGLYDEPVHVPSPRGQGTLSVLVRRYGDGMKLVLSQDITERERADAMRRDFVANVSHEIRTPLTVLAGFVESMNTLVLSDAERQRVLQLMSQQTERMQGLVADLLTLAQLEGSPRPSPDRWVTLGSVVDRVAADAAALSGGRHQISFEVDGLDAIAGNATELTSALGNLVHNAVRYTPAGGRIDVRWTVRPDGVGEFDVTDTGIGISREHLPRLTERFYRVDGSRSRETGGTGLGLSIVKHVAQRHGGELDVQSEPGKGSRFRITFPAARVRHAVADATPAALSGPAA